MSPEQLDAVTKYFDSHLAKKFILVSSASENSMLCLLQKIKSYYEKRLLFNIFYKRDTGSSQKRKVFY